MSKSKIPWKRDMTSIEDDIILSKRKIKKILISDTDILKALDDETILDDPLTALDKYIFSYVRIPDTQVKVNNYICFKINDSADEYPSIRNQVTKIQSISFVIFCNGKQVDTGLNIDRHDLIGYIIRDIFAWSNPLDMQWRLISNEESVSDTNFNCRTMIFQARKVNNITNGNKVINNIITKPSVSKDF